GEREHFRKRWERGSTFCDSPPLRRCRLRGGSCRDCDVMDAGSQPPNSMCSHSAYQDGQANSDSNEHGKNVGDDQPVSGLIGLGMSGESFERMSSLHRFLTVPEVVVVPF